MTWPLLALQPLQRNSNLERRGGYAQRVRGGADHLEREQNSDVVLVAKLEEK